MASKSIKLITMKKTILICAAVTLLTACNGNRANYTVEDDAYIEAIDSTGIMNVYAYEGNIKAHGKQPAAHYMVVISEQLDSVNGTYTMVTTYIEADTIKHHSKGRKSTHHGLPWHKNAKVYALTPDSGATDSVYLFVESDTTVILLDQLQQQPTHPEHYRLWKHKDHKTHHHMDHHHKTHKDTSHK